MKYESIDAFKDVNGYDLEGLWYPRVTKILEVKSKPGLDQFFREVGDFASAEKIKVESALHGSLVHEAAEKLLSGARPHIPKEIEPAMAALETFAAERGLRLSPELIEKTVWSSQYRYAGTVDALAEIDGKFSVLDIKTSTGFYPEYNLQTAAYLLALREYPTRQALGISRPLETRWILRVDQHRVCARCGATLREKGGRAKVRESKGRKSKMCEDTHEWGEVKGIVEMREFPFMQRDTRAFVAAKILWEWEHDYWLRQIGYLT